MPLEENDIRLLSKMFADAIQQSTSAAASAAAAAATSSISQRDATPRNAMPPVSIPAYKMGDSTSVSDYFVRCEWSFQLSQVAESDYKSYMLVHMGADLYNSLKVLLSPKKVEELSYVEVKDTLVKHFDRKCNQYAESIRYRQVVQEKEEALSDFVLRLRKAATHCNYAEFLDRMLTEQLLYGLQSRDICDEIISREPRTFNEAYEIAQRLEASHRSTVEMKCNVNNSNPIEETTCKVAFSTTRFKNKPKDEVRGHETSGVVVAKCYGCGGNHQRSKCKFRNASCFVCSKTGHIAKVCKSRTGQISEDDCDDGEIQRLNAVFSQNGSRSNKRMIERRINGVKIQMELDTGAPCGIMSRNTFRSRIGNQRLLKTDRRFTSYTGHRIECVGRVAVNVSVGLSTRKLNLYVVDGDFDALFGREWISQFVNEIDFVRLFSSGPVMSIKTATPHLSPEELSRLQSTLSKFDGIFGDTAGKLDFPPVKLNLRPDVRPVFAKARDVPFALRSIYAAEIDKKIASGFYKKVDFSEWASTTHIVSKKDGGIRITGNYKPTVNPRIIIDEHPIPKPENLFNNMHGAKLFCHLDITDAYSHLQIDDELAHALTLNTPTHGLIRPTRAVYGAANIPAIWQRTMETILQGINNVCNFFDDILIYADSFDNLLATLEATLTRLREKGLKLNRSKCVFAAPAVEFLGHKIDEYGVHKSDRHVAAVRDAPKPNLSTKSRRLRDVMSQKPFKWTVNAEKAYIDIKNALISDQVLMPYEPSAPLLLATDASGIGLGAVLSHRLPDGRERPIAFASRTLTATERKYPQIDKEALAIVWAVNKFFLYVYGRHFTLISDHKPLTQILDPSKSLPVLCISRMVNYANFLANFNFTVEFKTTKANANADYCSRAMRMDGACNTITEYDDFDGFLINQIDQLPTNATKIASETRKDEKLGPILRILESGKSLQAHGYRSPEINYRLSGGCLIFEHRVVIPETLRVKILQDLHSAHLGIVKMKGIARSFVYWPGIDKEIENVAKSCKDCAENANDPPKFRDHHWQYPKSPWERIHVDYAGPFLGSMLLIVTDAYSKWIEVKVTPTSTSSATITILDELFATYGVPTMLVSDNGTCFSSIEFKDYLTKIGVRYHKFTAPYHPSTNGQAERSVQTVKNAMKALGANKSSLQKHLNAFLRQYRIAPHSTTGQAPAVLFLGRNLRTQLDLILPQDLTTKMIEKQYMQFNATFRSFDNFQNVYFLSNNNRMPKWLPGVICRRIGDLHYEILYEGKCVKRHIDQIRSRTEPNSAANTSIEYQQSQDASTRWKRIHMKSRLSTTHDSQTSQQQDTNSSFQDDFPNTNTSYTTNFFTPLSDFHGFPNSEENNGNGDLIPRDQDVVLEDGSMQEDPGEDNGANQGNTFPLRKSSRIPRKRIIFSP
ncbi:uncharacterized protein K02A2.6-like isoform X3 [Stomoxys calcitrans]|uniref:uncharacterized protein K02A2.6-like isoform X3 n=1 Tax=Stomoxys calcitrans TaxID=35570 RepID=UPI0027E244D5|nr:uncharacterized protein K02A2.6-like isoform X3 [Stomoxys calcitrans]